MKVVIYYFLVGLVFAMVTDLRSALRGDGSLLWRLRDLFEDPIDIVAITLFWPLYLGVSCYAAVLKAVSWFHGRTEWNYHQGKYDYPGWDDACPNPGCHEVRRRKGTPRQDLK